MRPTKEQIEAGINSTGKYKQENGYSMTEHQAYVDGWYDCADLLEKLSEVNELELNTPYINGNSEGLPKGEAVDYPRAEFVSPDFTKKERPYLECDDEVFLNDLEKEEQRKDFCLWYYAESQPLDANKVFEWFTNLTHK
jgi:hypothetical protein